MSQRAADVRLKKHDGGEDDVSEQVPDEPVDRFEMPPLRTVQQSDQGAAANGHLHRSRSADEFQEPDRKSTRLNSSHITISYAVFCLKKKQTKTSATGWRLLPLSKSVIIIASCTS